MPPVGLQRVLALDLSPPRPWEFGGIDAFQWSEAVAMANAYHDGVRDADTEGRAMHQASAGFDRP